MTLKAGIYVDAENIMRSGGWGMRYDILKDFIHAQGGIVLRANTYMAMDKERENSDQEYAEAKADYRSNLRRYGFKLILKTVRRFLNKDGEWITKANADLELAIDSLLQARNLDYVVLVTGDGDFVRLVTALQNRGCRVDVVAFFNASGRLRETADNFISGFLLPGLIPSENGRIRGFMHTVNEEKYFGFLTTQKGLQLHDIDQDIFCHGRDVEGGILSNREFSRLKGITRILEFQTVVDDLGRRRAVNVTVVRPVSEELAPLSAGREPAKTDLPSPSPAEPDAPGESENEEGEGGNEANHD
ncbi:MAG: LabA-like NYN domain-containing protein [Planctomycetota bacterium]|jgi:uncharacterized LabA/DUF88 family protein/cold shock CspA family protein